MLFRVSLAKQYVNLSSESKCDPEDKRKLDILHMSMSYLAALSSDLGYLSVNGCDTLVLHLEIEVRPEVSTLVVLVLQCK